MPKAKNNDQDNDQDLEIEEAPTTAKDSAPEAEQNNDQDLEYGPYYVVKVTQLGQWKRGEKVAKSTLDANNVYDLARLLRLEAIEEEKKG